MNTIKNLNKHSVRNPFIIILCAIVLVVASYLVATSLLDRQDNKRFAQLDTSMQKIFQTVQQASEPTGWTYSKTCTEKLAGDWPTGEFTCSTMLSLEVLASSTQNIIQQHEKYYSLINTSIDLIPKTELENSPNSDFGRTFVVSSVERGYVEKNSDIKCQFLSKLTQQDGEYPHSQYGNPIEEEGILRISIICSDIARSAWYKSI